ncbi:hypothetical protein ABZ804_22400 [Streptomyces sp. NPDC047726]|uniref:hypothetical protein n=1 Tax=unclassified Streptomyces TaxID=2593676 RepID=UPI0033F9121B
MSDFNLGWGDEEEPDQTADTLTAVDRTRQDKQAAQLASAVEAARPGLDKVPDPVEPAGEGELTAEEQERLRLCDEGIDLGNQAWFIQGKALDTIATGRLFRATPHKLEPGRNYATIEEWAEVEKGVSVGQCSKLRAAWDIGEVLAARGFKPNPGQVREIIPVKTAFGLNAAVAVYVMVADAAGPSKITAARLRETVKMLPGDLELDQDDDVDVLAKTIKGVLVNEAPAVALPAIPAAVHRAVERRALDMANVLDRGRIPRTEVQRHLLEAFADPDDTVVYDAVLDRLKKAHKQQ